MSRVFVTGGSGFIGRALVERLLADGDEVVALARSPESDATLRSLGVRVARGELEDEDVLCSAMAGCTLAYNVAGINSLCLGDPGPMMRANIDGAVAAIRAAARAGVPRVVHTSSAATIGEPPGVVGTEETPHRGWFLSAYERSKTEGERAALAAGQDTGVEVVCVNPSSVQGPGRTSGTARFLLAFLDGRLKVFVPTMVSLIDIADCAEGHLLAAQRGVPGRRYLLNGMSLPVTEALSLAGEVAEVQRRPYLVPRPLAAAGASIVEHAWRVVGRRPPVCGEMVKTLLHGHRYDGSRSTRELGLSYTDSRETLGRIVEWGRRTGHLRPR